MNTADVISIKYNLVPTKPLGDHRLVRILTTYKCRETGQVYTGHKCEWTANEAILDEAEDYD